MALGKSCFAFLDEVAQAADRLANAAHHSSAPDHPLKYGPELDALKNAAILFRDNPYDAEAGGRLLDLASAVGRYLHAAPNNDDLPERSSEVGQLVQELTGDLGMEESKSVTAVVENVVVDTPYTEKAAVRLKEMLTKVGGATQDTAKRILTEVATAAAKKIMGL